MLHRNYNFIYNFENERQNNIFKLNLILMFNIYIKVTKTYSFNNFFIYTSVTIKK